MRYVVRGTRGPVIKNNPNNPRIFMTVKGIKLVYDMVKSFGHDSTCSRGHYK